jgi:hypothetical protein
MLRLCNSSLCRGHFLQRSPPSPPCSFFTMSCTVRILSHLASSTRRDLRLCLPRSLVFVALKTVQKRIYRKWRCRFFFSFSVQNSVNVKIHNILPEPCLCTNPSQQPTGYHPCLTPVWPEFGSLWHGINPNFFCIHPRWRQRGRGPPVSDRGSNPPR